MSKTAILQEQMYFVTMTVINWADIFTRQCYFDLIVNNLEYCQKQKGLEIYEYVIMTNHIHMICLSRNEPLYNILRNFKTFTSKQLIQIILSNEKESRRYWMIRLFEKAGINNKLNKRYQVWQNFNWPTVIDSEFIYNQKATYIHNNPVKAGFVNSPEDYYYSSANNCSPLKIDIA